MIDYVVGFAISEDKEKILLMKKERPEWQKGFLNGIGGKIEPGESGLAAMNRECLEETGLELSWVNKGIMHGKDFSCIIFYTFSDKIYEFEQKEDEWLTIFPTKSIRDFKCIPNLPYLIEFGISNDTNPYLTLRYS